MTLLLAVTAGVLLSAGRDAQAAALQYRVIDLGVTGGYTKSFGYGLSDNNYVAGWFENANGTALNAFRWSAGGGLQILDSSGGTGSRAFGVNDSGAVVGELRKSDGTREATLWQLGGTAQGLGTLNNAGSSVAFGISDSGTVTGWSDATPATQAFRWTSGSGMTSVGALVTGEQTRAYAINDAGTIAGWGTTPDGDRGFIDNGALTGFGQPGSSTRAFGISSNGYVVGDANDAGVTTAFLRDLNGTLISLGLLAGWTQAFGGDVNAEAAAVGWGVSGAGERAFLWTQMNGLLDLNTLIPWDTGWQLQRARSINDLGYIVGQGVNANGEVRAFLLEPVPEPATLLLIGCAGGVMGAFYRSRRRK